MARWMGLAAFGTVVVLASCAQAPAAVDYGDAAPDPEPYASASATPSSTPTSKPGPGIEANAAVRKPWGVAISMTFDQWYVIWSDLDSTVSVDVEGDAYNANAAKATLVQEISRDQVWRKGRQPKDSDVVTVRLSRLHWAYVLGQLELWGNVGEDVRDEPIDEWPVRDLINRQLRFSADETEPRPGPTTPEGYRGLSDYWALWLGPLDAELEYGQQDESFRHAFEVTRGTKGRGDAITLWTGREWSAVDLTVRTASSALGSLTDAVADGWEVGEESTVRIDNPWQAMAPLTQWTAPDVFVPTKPGLYRVRVLVRDRLHETDGGWDIPLEPERDRERFDVTFWPVDTVAADELVGSDADRRVPASDEVWDEDNGIEGIDETDDLGTYVGQGESSGYASQDTTEPRPGEVYSVPRGLSDRPTD